MKSTKMLMHEHEIIKRMLNILLKYAEDIEHNKKVSLDNMRKCVDFIKTFGDTCHHLKEEDVLFVEMETHGMPRYGGPVGVMLSEHETGRGYVRAMADAIDQYGKGNQSADREFAKNAKAYAGLLSQHIDKENNILYPMADEILADIDDEIIERFEEREKKLGEGVHEKYVNIIEQLEKGLSGN